MRPDGVDSLVVFVPVLLGAFRDLIRAQVGTKVKFPSDDLIVEVKCQSPLRYMVFMSTVARGSSNACVNAYRQHPFITFSKDGLLDTDRLETKGGVDWVNTSSPITFKVEKIENQLYSNTLHVDSKEQASILPTALSGAESCYGYLLSCLASPLVKSDSEIMTETVRAHFSMEKMVV
jgi:hypothetical protein